MTYYDVMKFTILEDDRKNKNVHKNADDFQNLNYLKNEDEHRNEKETKE